MTVRPASIAITGILFPIIVSDTQLFNAFFARLTAETRAWESAR